MKWQEIPEQQKKKLWQFAEELAAIGAETSLQYFGKDIGIEWKADESPVTQADRETEQAMRDRISEEHPLHAIHGEEFGTDTHAEYTWVLDPIDGTKSFINGVPLYCCLVALLYQGEPVVGVIYNPPSGELVSGCIGLGAHDETGNAVHMGDTGRLLRISTSDFADLMSALSTTPQPWLSRLLQPPVIARTWGDGYGYLLAATGRCDIMIDPVLELWDVAPVYPIIHEAGGVLCDINGHQSQLPGSAVVLSQQLYQKLFTD